MKRLIITMALLIASNSLMASPELKFGSTYYIKRQSSGADIYLKDQTPKWNLKNAFWVTIAKPIGDKKPGDTCFFVDGAKVILVGKHEKFGFLVNYIQGEHTDESCPNGTIAFVDTYQKDSFENEPTKNTPVAIEKAADKIISSPSK